MGLTVKRAYFLLSGTIAAGIYGSVAFGADIDAPGQLPAVSGVNGKVEFSAGYIDIDDLDDDAIFRGAASLSFPVGDMFGIQADVAIADAFGNTDFGTNLHAFTRSPDSYLFGVVGGYADFETANLWYVGPEIELYVNNFSVEFLGGYVNVDNGAGHDDKFFAIGDLALYATDNLRLTIGARTIASFDSAHAGVEWYMGEHGLPASFTLDGRIGEDGFASIQAGFSFYFGGEEKSLIRRHREDDPRNLSLDIFSAAAGGAAFAGGTSPQTAPPPPPEVPPTVPPESPPTVPTVPPESPPTVPTVPPESPPTVPPEVPPPPPYL
jgi:hypothetical protein